MSDAPLGKLIISDDPKRRRRVVGPLLAGLIAAVLATALVGSYGLVGSLLAVGSWWTYKFWPRRPAPEAPEARAFIDRLEGIRPDEIDAIPVAKPNSGEAIEDILL
jgi:hypothetical protein